MNRQTFNKWRNSYQTKSTLAIIVIATILVAVISVVQYWFAFKGIKTDVEKRANEELNVKSLEIHKIMERVQSAADNFVWVVEDNLDNPSEFEHIATNFMKHTPDIVGCGMGFNPQFNPADSLYELYLKKVDDNNFTFNEIGSESHFFLDKDWYVNPVLKNKGCWSEPYYDEAGAGMTLCTYSQPIHDKQGKIVGVLGVDLSLDWLGDVINATHAYESSYNIMISKTGKVMACPEDSMVIKTNININELTGEMKDTSVNSLNKNMMAGKRGQDTIINDDGEKNYVFYSPVEGDAGWSMAVVCSDSDVFGNLRKVGYSLFVVMLIGLSLLTYIMFRTVRGFKKLQAISDEKASIQKELKIASTLQMAMVPKQFPPFPNRDDVDVYGVLKPAKEVGGDLFDFYIRDEKLFFCIGDVSGKGVPAAIVMAMVKVLFRTVTARESKPDVILTIINNALSQDNESCMFVTCFIGVLDIHSGRMRYSNAGHNAPMLINHVPGWLPCDSNVPIGIMKDWVFTAQETHIDPDTVIFLYTDGLTEAEDVQTNQFGEQRMLEVMNNIQGKPEDIISKMTEEVNSFVGEANQSDDITMLAVLYTKRHKDVKMQKSITFTNEMENIEKLAVFVEETCEAVNFDMETTMQINLAIEEAVVNIINYAYPKNVKGIINVVAQANDNRLKFVISDKGRPFDPTARQEINTNLPIEDRQIGGLGIHLIRKIMDSINYERIDDENILTLRKYFNESTIINSLIPNS